MLYWRFAYGKVLHHIHPRYLRPDGSLISRWPLLMCGLYTPDYDHHGHATETDNPLLPICKTCERRHHDRTNT